MSDFAIGDGVTVTEGPMKGLYGVVVYFYEKEHQYLVRFGGSQQLYYDPAQIVPWT